MLAYELLVWCVLFAFGLLILLVNSRQEIPSERDQLEFRLEELARFGLEVHRDRPLSRAFLELVWKLSAEPVAAYQRYGAEVQNFNQLGRRLLVLALSQRVEQPVETLQRLATAGWLEAGELLEMARFTRRSA